MKRGSRMTHAAATALMAAVLVGCGCRSAPDPLTAAKAEAVVTEGMRRTEPAYAEVPRRVTFGPSSPRDAFDEKAVRTLRNLEREGYVTLQESTSPDGTYTLDATVTPKGFRLLGVVGSARGPALRAMICDRQFDRVQNFLRHPQNPTVGRLEIVWHYTNPTPLYELFETRMNKGLNEPFVTVVSIHWNATARTWQVGQIVRREKSS